jgi:hypothetical protein
MPPHGANPAGAAGSDLRVTSIVGSGKEFIDIVLEAGK